MNYVPGSSVIPFDDGSRASRVTGTIAHVNDNSVDTIYSTVFDEFFILSDELGRCLQQNSMLVFLEVFILFYQYYITTFLPFLPRKWDFSQFPDKALRYLTYPIDFGLGDPEILSKGGPSYFILIFDFLIFLYLLIIFIYHHYTKMFPKHHARIIRLLLSFIIPIMLSPSCYNIGFSFNSIFQSENGPIFIETNSTSTNQTHIIQSPTETLKYNRSYFISSTFFGIILYLFLLCVFFVDIMFRSSTPYLENTALSMWDGVPFFLLIFGSNMTNLTTRLIERLPNWSCYFLAVCCILYNSFILYKMFYFPMIKKWMNPLLSIFIGAGIIASLFQLFPIPSLYRFVIPPCFFVVLIPVFIIVFKILKRKIAREEITEKTLRSDETALRYLRILIACNCEEFISFNWVKIMKKLIMPNVITQIAQILSLFPSEHNNLTFFITLLSKNHQLKFHQRYLLFQIRQVNILRQSSSSKQLDEDLYEISKITNRAINSFSQFLIRIIDERRELSLDGLNFLSKVNRETNSICHEAMARYPNNSRLLFIFSRYVIECHADFRYGVSLFHEGQMIDRGKRTSIDVAFQSMVNLFPMYLWKRILNYKGQIIFHRKSSKSDSSMSADSISNEKDRNADQDIESNDKIASGVIESPRLRLALKKSVNNMSLVGIPFLTLNAIFRFLLGAIMFVVLMFVVPDLLQKRAVNYSSIAQINIFRKNLDLCLFRTAKLWSWSLGLAPRQDNITEYLDEGITIEDYNNLTTSPYEELFTKVIESVKSNEDLGKLLIEVKYKQSANIVGESSSNAIDKTNTDLLHVKNISFCNRKLQKVFEASTSLRYFSLYILNQVSIVTILKEIYNDPSEWKNDECICEIILNMHNIVSVLMEQSTVLIEREKIYSNTVEKDLILIIAILVPVLFVVFIIPSIAGYFKINREFQHVFDVLNLLPIKIYKDASKPIAIFQTNSMDQNSETFSQVERKSCQKLTIILPAIISTLLITAGLAGTLLLYLSVNKQFYTLVKWLELGSLRTPLVIEIVTHMIFAGIFGYLGSSDYTSHEHHLDLLMNYSRQLLLQHKSLIYGSNDLKPCYGFNEQLDNLHFTNSCFLNTKGESLRVNYRCQSLDQQIYTFNKLSKDVYFTMLNAQSNTMNNISIVNEVQFNQNFRNILNDYESINLHFLGITHLLPKLESAQNMLNDGVYLQVDHLKEYTYLICLLVLACTLIVFIIELIVMNNLKEDFGIVRILIARLPPISVVKSKQLVELIVGQHNKNKSRNLTPITINVQNCSSSIVIFDQECKIQLVNTATTKLFGFTKEQLYQSELSLIISKEDFEIIKDRVKKNSRQKEMLVVNEIESSRLKDDSNDEILASLLINNDYDNIDLNKNSPSSNEKIDLCQNPFIKTIVGVKDDGMQVILSATLSYLPAPDDVFALIMKDETSIYINEEDIKQAKLKANEILTNLLPAEIVESSRMKENISFSIKLLSVITIKILNFNDSIPHITSVQAIRNMTELFMMFDVQLLNYQTLTKTCVISGTYQAVGGLFNTNTIKNANTSPDFYQDEDLIDLNNDETEINLESGPDSDDSDHGLMRQNSILVDDGIEPGVRSRRNSIVIEIEQEDQSENDANKKGGSPIKVKPIASSPNFNGRRRNSNRSEIKQNISSPNFNGRRRNSSKSEIKQNVSIPNVKINNNIEQTSNSPKRNVGIIINESSSEINLPNGQSQNEINESSSSLNINSNVDQNKNVNKNEINESSSSPNVNVKANVDQSKNNIKQNVSSPNVNVTINVDQNKNEIKKNVSSPNVKAGQTKNANKNEIKQNSSSPNVKNNQNKKAGKVSSVQSLTSPRRNIKQKESVSFIEPKSSPSTKPAEPNTKTNKAEPKPQPKENEAEPKHQPKENEAEQDLVQVEVDPFRNMIRVDINQQASPRKTKSENQNQNQNQNVNNNNENTTNSNNVNDNSKTDNNNNNNNDDNKNANENNITTNNNDKQNVNDNNNNNNDNNDDINKTSTDNNNNNDSTINNNDNNNNVNNENDNNNNNNDNDTNENNINHNQINFTNLNENSGPRISGIKSSFIQGVTSIYSANLFPQSKVEAINDIILDSIYFAFNCLDATEYINNASGTNFVIGIGINIGGPCTAGTLGHEHMQFNVIGEAVKTSYLICNAAEAGNILISSDTYDQLKESSEAQKNFDFEKYKTIDLLHSKRTTTYVAKPSEIFKQERNMENDSDPQQQHPDDIYDNDNDNNNNNENDDDNDDDNNNDNDNLLDGIPTSDVPLEQQMNSPDDM